MEPSTLSSEPASSYERGASAVIVTLLVIASVVTLLLHGTAAAFSPWFIPAFAGATGTADLLSSVLLFGLYVIEGRRLVLYAALAYFVDTLLIVPYAMTYPNVISSAGFLGNEQSSAWLWVVWHFSMPVLLLAGLAAPSRADEPHARLRGMLPAIAGCLAYVAAWTLMATAGHAHLPRLLDRGTFLPLFAWLSFLAAVVNLGCAIAFLARREALTAIGLWFTVATVVSGLDATLNSFAISRYSAAWYVGKVEQFMTASVIFVSLLGALCVRYMRSIELVSRLRAAIARGESLQVRLDREHEIALALQQNSLPRTLPAVPGVDLHAVYRPAIGDLRIGGDWYDVFETTDGRLVITIGDVSGKGLEASLVMGRVRQSLRHAAYVDPSPGAMLALADLALRAEDTEKMVTAFVAVLDRSGILEWASAGHPCPLLRQPGGAVEELYAPGLPLGLRAGIESDVRRSVLLPGALLVMFTDGLVEANHDYVAGLGELSREVAAAERRPGTDLAAELYDRLVATAAQDDVAIVTLAFDPVAEAADGVSLRFAFEDYPHDDAVA